MGEGVTGGANENLTELHSFLWVHAPTESSVITVCKVQIGLLYSDANAWLVRVTMMSEALYIRETMMSDML